MIKWPYFIGSFWLLLGGSSTTAVRLAFKSQRYTVQSQSNNILLHHSQHAKNQLNSWTCSYNTTDFSASWTKWRHPFLTMPTKKTIEITFSSCKKSVHSIYSSLRCSQFRVLWPDWPHPFLPRLATPIFDHAYPKSFWSTFSLCEFASIRLFHRFLLETQLKKYPAIWLAENILAHTSGTKIFPYWGFVQEHRK